jgi:hypothetical protein
MKKKLLQKKTKIFVIYLMRTDQTKYLGKLFVQILQIPINYLYLVWSIGSISFVFGLVHFQNTK